jgi:hypothetical protein
MTRLKRIDALFAGMVADNRLWHFFSKIWHNLKDIPILIVAYCYLFFVTFRRWIKKALR